MRRLSTRLGGLVLTEPTVHRDRRGFFLESCREDALSALGVCEHWVQDNHSRSARGVLRGLHFSVEPGQAKLVRCARGSILDVVVDLRRGSPSFGEWESVVLDDRRHLSLYIPVGFAHGFCVTSEVADVIYRCSDYYEPGRERGIAFDDPDVGVAWPDLPWIVSERDRTAPRLREVVGSLPFVHEPSKPPPGA